MDIMSSVLQVVVAGFGSLLSFASFWALGLANFDSSFNQEDQWNISCKLLWSTFIGIFLVWLANPSIVNHLLAELISSLSPGSLLKVA